MKAFLTLLRVLFIIFVSGCEWTGIKTFVDSSQITKQGLLPSILPKGYLVYPGDRVAYKVYEEWLTWDEARDHCISDGGDLAIADTLEKIQIIENLLPDDSYDLFHVGIQKPYGSLKWTTVAGAALSLSPILWANIELPSERYERLCAEAMIRSNRLISWGCSERLRFICEISSAVYPVTTTSDPSTLEVLAEFTETSTEYMLPSTSPENYPTYPGNNVAYKIYENQMTWDEARDHCISDGGDLAIADTLEKIQIMENLLPDDSYDLFHVGIQKPYGSLKWTTVAGAELSLSPILWANIELPSEHERLCAEAMIRSNRLISWGCSERLRFICEISSAVYPVTTTSDPSTLEAELTETTTQDPLPSALPEGYSIYPGNNVAYKIHKDRVTWDEAHNRCISDGGNLAIANPHDLVQHVRTINSDEKAWWYVGIHKPVSSTNLTTVEDGSAVTSSPRPRSQPIDDRRACPAILSLTLDLWYIDCKLAARSICEIPINEENYVIVNNTPTVKVEPAEITTQAPPPIILPEGYSPFPDENVAYKIYKDNVTWDEARDRCISDGGDLAVVYTRKRIQQTMTIDSSVEWLHVGIHKLYGRKDWIKVNDGLPATSITWGQSPSEYSGRACALLVRKQHVIWNVDCSVQKAGSVCEIPIGGDPVPINDAFSRFTFPEGYSIFNEGKLGYKIYKFNMSWDEARDRCISDGGDLAAVDTWSEIRFMRRIDFGDENWLHIGIHKPFGTANWVGVHDGLPMISSHWGRSPIQDDRRSCAVISLREHAVWDIDCIDGKAGAICEIRIEKELQLAVTNTTRRNVTRPGGYVEFSRFHTLYKVYKEYLTHNEASLRCISDGGHLAVVDSSEKNIVVASLFESKLVHVGIHLRSKNSDEWIADRDGEPLKNLSWAPNHPHSTRCAALRKDGSGLEETICSNRLQFLCEIRTEDAK